MSNFSFLKETEVSLGESPIGPANPPRTSAAAASGPGLVDIRGPRSVGSPSERSSPAEGISGSVAGRPQGCKRRHEAS